MRWDWNLRTAQNDDTRICDVRYFPLSWPFASKILQFQSNTANTSMFSQKDYKDNKNTGRRGRRCSFDLIFCGKNQSCNFGHIWSKQFGKTWKNPLVWSLIYVMLSSTLPFLFGQIITTSLWPHWNDGYDWGKYLEIAEHVRLANSDHLLTWLIKPYNRGCLKTPRFLEKTQADRNLLLPDTGDKFSSPFAFSQAARGPRCPRSWCRLDLKII